MEIRYPSKHSKDKKERKLGVFVLNLRMLYKQGKLSKEEIAECESIPGWKWEIIYNWCTKEEFIQWCKNNKIKNQKQFHKWCKENQRPDNIISNPFKIYENWSWSIISGRYIYNNWCSKEEFIQWCKDNKIENQKQFYSWCKKNQRPDNIISNPFQIYKDWSWGDVSGKYRNVDWCTKKEFIQWCKKNNIKNISQFHKWCKKNQKPKNIPSNPIKIYKNWSWGDVSGRYFEWCSKDEFIQWCKENNIKNVVQFKKWCKENRRPDNIPSSPEYIYKDFSWGDISGRYRKEVK